MIKRVMCKEGLGSQLGLESPLEQMVFMRDWDISDTYVLFNQTLFIIMALFMS